MKILVVTSYMSKIRELYQDGFTGFCVARFPPSWWKGRCLRAFAPSEGLLRRMHDAAISKTEISYFDEYLRELENNPEGVALALQDMRTAAFVGNKKKVALLCYEKEHNTCHRSVLANYLKGMDLQDFEGWEEWQRPLRKGMLGR